MKRISNESDLSIGRAIDIFESALSLSGITEARERARWAVITVDDEAAIDDEMMTEAEFVRRVANRLVRELHIPYAGLIENLPAKYAPGDEDEGTEDVMDLLDKLDDLKDAGHDAPPVSPWDDPDPTPTDSFGPYWGVDKGDEVRFSDRTQTLTTGSKKRFASLG